MTVLAPVAVAERALQGRKPSGPRPSQRDLVAKSLLLCPDRERS